MSQEPIIDNLFTLTEPEFCSRYGLDREIVKQVRKESLLKDEDWSWTPGQPVILFKTALEKLSKLLGLEISEIAEPSCIAIVELCSSTNRHLIFAKLNGEDIRVRVQTNARFIPGMQLKVKKDPLGLPIYYADQPLPRFRGKY